MSLNQLTIKQAHEGLKEKKFSSLELTRAVLEQIKKRDSEIHAFLTVTEDLAEAQAKKVDEKIQRGEEIGVLEGIPCALKDNILVKDIKCTAGSKILENYLAPYDATVVQKLKKAGAIILGKTNLDEFAMGSSTENSAFGPTKNPRDLERVPGGSSGGSAAAVAADECIFALGSDTGGSIRQPASFCGVVGLKPTYGAVSRYGLMAMASSLDQIGCLTKTTEDAALVFSAINGKDEMDSTSTDFRVARQSIPPSHGSSFGRLGRPADAPNDDGIADSSLNLKNIKIGIPDEYFAKGIDHKVEEKIRAAILNFEQLGAKINSVSLPHTPYALPCYYIIVPSEVSANLARYDGIKYGISEIQNPTPYLIRGKIQNLLDVYLKTRGSYFGAEPRRRIMLGTYVLSAGYYDAYYLKAQKVRALIKQDFDKAFAEFDILITPTAPTTAFKIGEKIDDPLQMYLSDIYTVPINLAGLPAISLPIGNVDGLPVGLQIVGRRFADNLVLRAAALFEAASPRISVRPLIVQSH